MTTKDEFVKQTSTLPGVGKASAEKLYAAGFTDREKLLAASLDELKAAGLTAKVAQAVHDGLRAAPRPATEIKEVEEIGKTPAPAAETRIVEEREHVPKQKARLTDALLRALRLRNNQNHARPEFHRQEWWRYKRLGDKWRQPRGYHSKQREGRIGHPPKVKVGYRGVAAARDLHPSGFREVLVHNTKELEGVDAATQAVRISHTVGARKRKLLLQAAADKGLRVLNPGGVQK